MKAQDYMEADFTPYLRRVLYLRTTPAAVSYSVVFIRDGPIFVIDFCSKLYIRLLSRRKLGTCRIMIHELTEIDSLMRKKTMHAVNS